jgi:hypothetical protein
MTFSRSVLTDVKMSASIERHIPLVLIKVEGSIEVVITKTQKLFPTSST